MCNICNDIGFIRNQDGNPISCPECTIARGWEDNSRKIPAAIEVDEAAYLDFRKHYGATCFRDDMLFVGPWASIWPVGYQALKDVYGPWYHHRRGNLMRLDYTRPEELNSCYSSYEEDNQRRWRVLSKEVDLLVLSLPPLPKRENTSGVVANLLAEREINQKLTWIFADPGYKLCITEILLGRLDSLTTYSPVVSKIKPKDPQMFF